MARTQKTAVLAPLRIHTVSLTPDVAATLKDLQQECSDQLGRTVSASAIVRALLRLAARQSPPVADITMLISDEVDTGRVWGWRAGQKQPKRSPPRGSRGSPFL